MVVYVRVPYKNFEGGIQQCIFIGVNSSPVRLFLLMTTSPNCIRYVIICKLFLKIHLLKIQIYKLRYRSDQLYNSCSLLPSLSACKDLHVSEAFFQVSARARNKLQLNPAVSA